MIKIFKSLRVHKELRIRQEVYFGIVVYNSQNRITTDLSTIREYESVNKAVGKVESKICWILFVFSDLFGVYKTIRERSNLELKEKHNITI